MVGRIAVEQDARADHIVVSLGVVQGSGTGAAVTKLKGAAPFLQGVEDGVVALDLHEGVFRAGVGVGEVLEQTLHFQAGLVVHGLQLIRGGVQVFQGAKDAQAAHAGVRLQVAAELFAQLHGLVRKALGHFQAVNGLGDVVVNQLIGILHWRIAQHQDGAFDAGVSELFRLVQAGHGQVVRPQGFQLLGHRHGTVTVGVGLDQADEFAVGRTLPQEAVVVCQAIEMDLCPGSSSLFCHVHSLPFYFSKSGSARIFQHFFTDFLRRLPLHLPGR